jgi:hypothetical protein
MDTNANDCICFDLQVEIIVSTICDDLDARRASFAFVS